MLDKLSSKEVTDTILAVLTAYHMRESDRINSTLSNFPHNNRWHELWPAFQARAENDEMALSHFTQFIMAQLDGGDYTLPDGITLE